jgi:hypothetical protein
LGSCEKNGKKSSVKSYFNGRSRGFALVTAAAPDAISLKNVSSHISHKQGMIWDSSGSGEHLVLERRVASMPTFEAYFVAAPHGGASAPGVL